MPVFFFSFFAESPRLAFERLFVCIGLERQFSPKLLETKEFPCSHSPESHKHLVMK